ncbi:hypothetical protein QR680_007013 [Steinernema hermaphroditum]|uniref:Uncharacterized protein n=1 Tax=Steinernema hermaphroditum TaxID=289476 RepID=A0AA39LYC2_9BILA|nr:hypothetical protein QR680_007013 [Steinernema hermaphroditum]
MNSEGSQRTGKRIGDIEEPSDLQKRFKEVDRATEEAFKANALLKRRMLDFQKWLDRGEESEESDVDGSSESNISMDVNDSEDTSSDSGVEASISEDLSSTDSSLEDSDAQNSIGGGIEVSSSEDSSSTDSSSEDSDDESDSEYCNRSLVQPATKPGIYCIKCCRKQQLTFQRRDHVGAHLELEVPCPYKECTFSAQLQRLGRHLREVHSIRLSQMKLEMKLEYEAAKEEFLRRVDAAMSDYF